MNAQYKYDIFEAITKIRDIEGDWVVISVPIPNKAFEFLRYKEYPYKEPFISPGVINDLENDPKQQFLANKLFTDRINPYFKEYGAMIKQNEH